MIIYIIIWVSPYVLFVRSLSPPKLAGLAPPKKNFADILQIGRGTMIAQKKFIEHFLNFLEQQILTPLIIGPNGDP
jgi:hypothetical protein